MSTINIYCAAVEPTMTEGEYQMQEVEACEYGEQWNGDVRGYIENLYESDYEYELHDEGALGNIHQPCFDPIPESICVVYHAGEPVAVYWASREDKD